jgi:PEP-CTERM motif
MRFRDIVIGAFTLATAIAATPSIAMAGPNLITNGDFTAGFSGFTTQYDVVAPAPNALFPEGTITIADNPNSVHQYWVNLGTTYPLLLVNGATSGSPVIWEEDNILTSQGGAYQFSANVMDICCNASFGSNSNSPSDILFQVNVNGSGWIDLADYLTAPGAIAQSGDSGILEFISADFTSTAGGQFDIRAMNNIDVAGGNDFALTNIAVTAVPEPVTIALFGTGLVAAAAMRRRKKAVQA